MTLVMAPPASGKGVMTNAQRLIAPIDQFLQACGRGVTIAADSSSVTFFECLRECGGNAFMMATEIDELSQAMRKDGGIYSSLFRQAFEHETWKRTRYRGQTKIQFVVEQPRLSVLLSGTQDQLKPLLKQGENGLASRFITYLLSDSSTKPCSSMATATTRAAPLWSMTVWANNWQNAGYGSSSKTMTVSGA